MKEPTHTHHIIPRHMGGTNEPANLVELTVKEHAEAHLKLYEEQGKYEDWCAYLMLSGKNQDPEFIRTRAILGGAASQKKRKDAGLIGAALFYGKKVTEEEILLNCSRGGTIQGKINADNGHMRAIQKMADCSAAGKKGGAATIASGKGAFGDPVERLKSCSKGGTTQGKINAESGHLKRISALSKRATGKIWLTNGTKNMMIEPEEQIPEGFCRGKTQKKRAE